MFKSELETLLQCDLKCTADRVSVSAVVCRERSPWRMELVVFSGNAAIQRDKPEPVYVGVLLCAGHCWEIIFLLLR